MGIPKFYRWLSERYPLLNMPVTATEAPPEIDNLYLDMNGIIHNCTHANDPNLKLTETEMVIRIFSYLDKLIHIMKPRKLVFMAIDGVAPRAKMNQQRSRRFKTAVERLALEAEKKAKGEETPEEYKFDSNCITPGTGFMARLGRHIRFFVRKKLSEDPVWQQPVVIFSGHDVPGEGEHKIMEYIRWQKRSPSYTPNQRHCMYGLDADLIMLSLVTHEPHFCLLREVVSFTGKNRGQPSRETLANPSAENFILFQIGLLREYIELEFSATLGQKLSFPIDVERVVDDIVLFCMLVGNDFLPALPTLDIAEGALNQLIDTYKLLLPKLGGYLTHAGELNHERLQVLLGAVADRELSTLEERATDTEWFESKRGKHGGRGGGGSSRPGTSSSSRPATGSSSRGGRSTAPPAAAGSQTSPLPSFFALEDLGDAEGDDRAAARLPGRNGAAAVAAAVVVPDLEGFELEAADEPEVGPTMMSKEARQLFLSGGGEEALMAWKERYYKEKLEMPDAGPASTHEVVQHYIRGLHWVLQYYYHGVASWDWFYPYHYAPMAQDMRRLDNIDVSFSRGRPFRPFEQLLAVLPSASCTLLPPAFEWLMTDPRSPILDFYPEKFDIDMEGKRAEWEGVVKVPFISEERLLAAAASVPPERSTAEERSRNIPGDMLVFEYAAGRHEPEHCASDLPQHFASITMSHSTCRHVPVPDPLPDKDRGFVPALGKGTLAGKKNPPGFPTLKTMSNLRVELKMAGVNIFGHPAKKESLVLQLPDVRDTIASDAAAPLLRGMLCGRVYVKWPYLQEAEIVAVSDARQRISVSGIEQHSSEAAAKWQGTAGITKNAFMTKMGIDIGPLPIMLDVRVCSGYKRGADGSVAKEYGKELVPYPLQAVLQSRPRPPSGFADPDAPKALALSPGTRVVWLGQNYFGCVGTVLADPAAKVTGSSQMAGYVVRLQPLHRELLAAESRARHTVQQCASQFMPSGAASRSLRLNPRLLGRLTGNVWVEDSAGNRVDIGLAVKNAKQGLCVPTLCRPAGEGTGWMYSAALVDLVQQYKARFPNIIQALEPNKAAAATAAATAAYDGSLEGGGRGGASRDGRDGQQKLTMGELFPGLEPHQQDAKLQEVAAWLKTLPSAKSPLVAMTAQQASDAAVDRLQMQLPGLLPVGTGAMAPVDLEQVHPSLLLPPHDPAAPQSVLAGGAFEPGDRVVVLRGTGSPPFGSRGTVIGVLPNVIEVLMDQDYAGGSTLNGRIRSARGGYLAPEQLLNVSKRSPVQGAGPKPRAASAQAVAAAAAVKRSSKGAGTAGDSSVTSPRTASAAVMTRIVELAPWLKGKQMQPMTAAQQQHQALQQQMDQEQQAAAPAAAAAPASQGGRLLQMLKQGQQGGAQPQQKQQPQCMVMTGPGLAAAAASAAAADAAATAALNHLPSLQQQQQQQVAAAPQQPPQPAKQPLGHALQAAAQQQPQQQQPAQGPPLPAATATAARAPSEPSAAAGHSLLRRLQKGGSSGGLVPPAAAAPEQPESQPHLYGEIQKPARKQQQQKSAATAVSGAPAAAPAVAQQADQPAAAGAHLLAMLKNPTLAPAAAAATPPAAAAAADRQQQPGVKIVPRAVKKQQQQPAAAEAAAAATGAATAVATAAVVGAPAAAKAGQPKQEQDGQQQQQAKSQQPKQQQPAKQTKDTLSPAQSTEAPAAAPAQQQHDMTSQHSAAASAPQQQQQQRPYASPAVAVKTRRASSSDETGEGRTAQPRTPPAGAGNSLLGRVAIQAKLPDGTRGFTMGRGQRMSSCSGGGAPGTPPAPGSSSSGGGGVAAAAVNGVQNGSVVQPAASPQPMQQQGAQQQGAQQQGSAPRAAQQQQAAGHEAAQQQAQEAARAKLRSVLLQQQPAQPEADAQLAQPAAAVQVSQQPVDARPLLQQQLQAARQAAAAQQAGSQQAAQAKMQGLLAQLSLSSNASGAAGLLTSPPPGAAAAPAVAAVGEVAGQGGSGQALMMMLQRGASKGAAPTPPQQQQQQQQPPVQMQMPLAPLSPVGPVAAAAPAVGPPADPVAAANTNAACNLLRRLQKQQSAGPK